MNVASLRALPSILAIAITVLGLKIIITKETFLQVSSVCVCSPGNQNWKERLGRFLGPCGIFRNEI